MKNASVGFRVHSGWSAMAAVCLEKGGPKVLHRERIHLVEEFTYRLRQPYHTAEKMPLVEARKFIGQAQATAKAMAERSIRSLQKQLKQLNYDLHCAALLLASGKPLPELEMILASHAMIHTADGELFREALTRASVRCGLQVVSLKEKEVAAEAGQVLGLAEAAVSKRVAEMGRELGAPWGQDEKLAALAAWLALAGDDKCET
ncbi:MAG TPA: hypothetical protein VMU53_09635 [Candidatus Sulfotelmatobacter sp.]|nr:hypothetical protein [Candidatus Sulfotelmatobacter sp.]